MPVEAMRSQERASRSPLVTVVIPVHNAATWIRETLASVSDQDCHTTPFEVVVVDDGSTDGSAGLACTVLGEQDFNWRVYRITNSGPSRARNVGWRAARGSWIQFLDADDLLHPRKLQQQGLVASTADPSTAVLYSDWSRIELRGGAWEERLPRCKPRVSESTLDALISTEHFLQLGCALIQRSWLESVGGFREEQMVIEDVNLLIRISLAGGGFRHVPTEFPAVYYRQHPNSLSRRRDDLFAEGCYLNAKLVEGHWTDTRSLTPERRALLGRIYLYVVEMAGTRSKNSKMLGEVVRLTLPGAARSRAARRVLLRALAYRYLGRALGAAFERTYLRVAGFIRVWGKERSSAVPSSKNRGGARPATPNAIR